MEKMKFYQWLNAYESITKREYNEMSNSLREHYKFEYDKYLKDDSYV